MTTEKKNTKKAATKVESAETAVEKSSTVKPIVLGQLAKVESISTGTLVLKFDLVSGLTLKAGDQVIVNGDSRVISNVTRYEKKKQISIATQGYGKWPVGPVEVTFKSS